MPKFTDMKYCISILASCFFLQILSFSQAFEPLDIPFVVEGASLDLALVGGLNSPQFSEVDFNNDGQMDLYVFDRVGDVQMAFVNDGIEGAVNYTAAPEYLVNFPPIKQWILLRDYNDDGIQDIFAFSDVPGYAGIMVFKGFYNNGIIDFERITFPEKPEDLLFFPNPIPNAPDLQIYITNIDYPAIDDMDCDGDLDILTFNPGGGYVELFTNLSVEQGYGKDTLIFDLADDCWGGIYESGLLAEVDLSPSMGECYENLTDDDVEFRHAGSTLLTLDMNNDGAKELILGDLSFENLVYLTNAGNCEVAWMNQQDVAFPSTDVSVEIPIFPAAFYLDINQDEVPDLLAAANNRLNAEDNEVWFYENTGTPEAPQFELEQQDFLVGEMIDMGSGANPVFVDYNADGLMDLVVGNFSFFQSFAVRDVRLYLFKNVGTLTQPRFELVDTDYLNMNQFSQNATNYAPAFGDLDGDGDLDLIVGDDMGQLFYAENASGPGNPLSFGSFSYGYMGINVGQTAAPFIVDLDRDGLLDIVIGEKNGNVNFFKNVGTVQEPAFDANQDNAPNTSALGNLDARTPGLTDGYSVPFVIEIDDSYLFAMGTNHGRIELYSNIENNIYGSFTEMATMLGNVDDGNRTRPAFFDINNDGFLDMLIGNFRGGLTCYTTDLPSGVMVSSDDPDVPAFQIKVFPNPASTQVDIRWDGQWKEGGTIEAFTVTGKQILMRNLQSQTTSLDISSWPVGVYFLKINFNGQYTTKKLVVSR